MLHLLTIMLALLHAQPAQLVKVSRFTFDAAAVHPSVRVQVWEKPQPGRCYVIGADFAYGIGRDRDTACVLDKTCEQEGQPARQVAEIDGDLGERFEGVLYALHRIYNDAFILGERQVGLFILRRLWDHYGVRNLYRQQSITKTAVVEDENPELGWHRGGNDVTLQEFRKAVRDRKIVLRSRALLEQMGRMEWKPRSDDLYKSANEPDAKLTLKLRGGGSPDLAIAAMYANYALSQVALFEKPKPMFPPGSYGDVLGLANIYGPQVGTGLVVHKPGGR